MYKHVFDYDISTVAHCQKLPKVSMSCYAVYSMHFCDVVMNVYLMQYMIKEFLKKNIACVCQD